MSVILTTLLACTFLKKFKLTSLITLIIRIVDSYKYRHIYTAKNEFASISIFACIFTNFPRVVVIREFNMYSLFCKEENTDSKSIMQWYWTVCILCCHMNQEVKEVEELMVPMDGVELLHLLGRRKFSNLYK